MRISRDNACQYAKCLVSVVIHIHQNLFAQRLRVFTSMFRHALSISLWVTTASIVSKYDKCAGAQNVVMLAIFYGLGPPIRVPNKTTSKTSRKLSKSGSICYSSYNKPLRNRPIQSHLQNIHQSEEHINIKMVISIWGCIGLLAVLYMCANFVAHFK